MRRHSSLAVTSAIVLLGGAGVFGDGAISLRTSTVTGHLKAVRAFQHALRTRRAGEAPVGPSSPLLDDLAATTPFAVPVRHRTPPVATGRDRAPPRHRDRASRHGGAVARPARLRVGRPIRRGHGQRLLRRLPVRADDVVGTRLRRPAERSPARGPESCRRSPAAHRRLVGVAGLLGGRRSVVRPTATRAGSRYCSHHQPCRRGLEAKVVRRGARRSAVRRRHRLDLR